MPPAAATETSTTPLPAGSVAVICVDELTVSTGSVGVIGLPQALQVIVFRAAAAFTKLSLYWHFSMATTRRQFYSMSRMLVEDGPAPSGLPRALGANGKMQADANRSLGARIYVNADGDPTYPTQQ